MDEVERARKKKEREMRYIKEDQRIRASMYTNWPQKPKRKT